MVATTQTGAKILSQQGFILTTELIAGIHLQATVVTDAGHVGMVYSIQPKAMTVLLLSAVVEAAGTSIRPLHKGLYAAISPKVLGQTVTVNQMLHTKATKATAELALRPLFAEPLGISARAIVNEQLETGVTMVDALFPIVKGQRIAVIGDSKAGKSTFITQAATHNLSKTQTIAIFVQIAKRKQDVERLAFRLYQAGVADRSLVVVADGLDNIVLQYLAPFVGCAAAEHFWDAGHDVVLVYDDLATHAKIYREMALLTGQPPGRESYPADLFHLHSNLLERAGKRADTGKSLSVFAVATTPNDDLTGYFPTNMISTTDGQLIFDLKTQRSGLRPAINIGLSVSRVGGRSQSGYYQDMADRILQSLSQYTDVEKYAQFNTKLSPASQKNLAIGKKLRELFVQDPANSYSLAMQRVMLEAIFMAEQPAKLNVTWLKSVIGDVVTDKLEESRYRSTAKELIKSNPSM